MQGAQSNSINFNLESSSTVSAELEIWNLTEYFESCMHMYLC